MAQASPDLRKPAEHTDSVGHRLPDFCQTSTVFTVMVITELAVLIISFAADPHPLAALAPLTAFAQWLALATTALLCALRAQLLHHSVAVATATCALTTLACVAALSWAAVAVNGLLSLHYLPPPGAATRFILANAAIATLLCLAALRYFYLTERWREHTQLEAQAQFRALQARIRPHFLFNSMNSIAALIRSAPETAEQAVEELSDLFRVALSNPHHKRTTLGDELKLIRGYLHLESLRLGKRMQVTWNMDGMPLQMRMPPLLVQPLVENAIYHGIAECVPGGELMISGRQGPGRIFIEVANTLPARGKAHTRSGHGIALQNIRDRLEHYWGAEASLTTIREQGLYRATLVLPRADALEE